MLTNTRIGILGGGQLGKMLVQAGSRWNLDMWIMDKELRYPAANVTNQFIVGDFKDYEDVCQLGKRVDVLTIEIETINLEALAKLERDGKKIYPSPKAIGLIKDKGIQKSFYKDHNIPTSPFRLIENANEIHSLVEGGTLTLPFVQKARMEGYDGRGVHVVNDRSDLENILDQSSLIEDKVAIEKELAIIVARRANGEKVVYDPVEMVFHPTANLVEYLVAPACIDRGMATAIKDLALAVIDEFEIVGLLAIELFLTTSGEILVNEVAPRPHNSGHHTIEACNTSQYEQHLRAVLDLPLGDPSLKSAAAMVNLLGAPDHYGDVYYQGLEKCLEIPNVHVHLYGKSETRPFRKMGHVTVLAEDLQSAMEKAKFVRQTLKVIS
ncbi:MAG: 5-(carboxyamino)imidazole ribonucleotide synthase [Saprospiraceae bacterium]|nr:5-(carboxyamino)imidazole ribonucleotide synthase [Saprospiraceae bacterium]